MPTLFVLILFAVLAVITAYGLMKSNAAASKTRGSSVHRDPHRGEADRPAPMPAATTAPGGTALAEDRADASRP